jgi:hypothetical protein
VAHSIVLYKAAHNTWFGHTAKTPNPNQGQAFVIGGFNNSVFGLLHPLIFFLACALLTSNFSAKIQTSAQNFKCAAVLWLLARTKRASHEKLL